MIIIYR